MNYVIIVGVDESTTASAAALTAASLANSLDAELHVVTAYGVRQRTIFTDGVERTIYANISSFEGIAKTQAAALKAEFPHLRVKSSAVEGKPAAALVAAAEALSADFIVVGNKGVQGPSRVLGSIARAVSAEATCDVYIANTRLKKRQ